jgi:hypothetical protein
MIRRSKTILSLAATLLSLALWAKSFLRPARWELLETDRTFLTVTIDAGCIAAHLQRAPATEDGLQTFGEWKRTGKFEWSDYVQPRRGPRTRTDMLTFLSSNRHFSPKPMAPPRLPSPPPHWSFQSDDTSTSLSFPLWLPTAIFSLGLIPAVLGLIRRRYRRNRGLCLKCGYDLTGLPQPRCPECGATFSDTQTPAAPNTRSPRLLKRAALMLCLFILLAWGTFSYWQLSVSQWQRVSLGRNRILGLGLRRGCLICECYPPEPVPAAVRRNEWSSGFGRYGFSVTWTPSFTAGPYSRTLELPLWLFLAVTAPPTALLWWCDRRQDAL